MCLVVVCDLGFSFVSVGFIVVSLVFSVGLFVLEYRLGVSVVVFWF